MPGQVAPAAVRHRCGTRRGPAAVPRRSPVSARPVRPWERGLKRVRRSLTAVALAPAAALALGLSGVGALVGTASSPARR